MKSHRTAPPALDEKAIDALYGLEPVFEPAATAAAEPDSAATEFTAVQCPYCGEPFETQLDLSAGSATYIEDCQICCQPIELAFEVSNDGAPLAVTARRTD